MAMRNPRRDSLVGSADRIVLGGLAVSLLTSVHHYYGAYVYKTPWRRHAALVIGLATAAALGSLLVLRRRTTSLADAVAIWFLTADTLVVHVGGFGVFEGGYNHLLKDVLYLGGASPALLRRLFPAPRYEVPDDAFFEVTGVLQVVLAAVTGYYLYRLVQELLSGVGAAGNLQAA
jgi:hypothetical protein